MSSPPCLFFHDFSLISYVYFQIYEYSNLMFFIYSRKEVKEIVFEGL